MCSAHATRRAEGSRSRLRHERKTPRTKRGVDSVRS